MEYSKEFLKAFSEEHLRYEVECFYEISLFLSNEKAFGAENETDLHFLNMALIESFIIHLRNIIDFFYIHPKDDDIIAEFYYPNWENNRPKKSELLRNSKIRANKELAHLTTLRKNGIPKEKSWDIKRLRKEINGLFNEFFEGADSDLISPSVELTFKKYGS